MEIAPLRPEDRSDWETLARGYKAFYGDDIPDEDYARVWAMLMAGEKVHGLAARIDGAMAGIAHYLFHPQAWLGEACYLQDLFTAEAARGRGVGTALIDRVADEARARHAVRFYWLTKEDNLVARSLYDRVARFKGFLRYDYPL
jgi:GNAT superfamily N-acetyltransferase